MIKSISTFFQSFLVPEPDDNKPHHTIQFATAALMMEVTRADQDRLSVERDEILLLLEQLFDFAVDELQQLVELAEVASDEAHDLYTFTKLVNEYYDYEAKKHLIENLWQVAYADGRVDAFEEHIIRRISGLLYLDNEDFVHAKIRARNKMENSKG